MLWMAVASQSSVKSSRWNSASSGMGSKPFTDILVEIIRTTLIGCAVPVPGGASRGLGKFAFALSLRALCKSAADPAISTVGVPA